MPDIKTRLSGLNVAHFETQVSQRLGAPHSVADFARSAALTEGNPAGQRNRMMRNLSASQWRALYGRSYVYSSDYIHTNRHAFARPTRLMARAANVTEELAEAASCLTGMHIRFVGSIIPGTLRELSGKARFLSRLRQQLKSDRAAGTILSVVLGKPVDGQGDRYELLYCKLQEHGLIDGSRAHLTCDLSSPATRMAVEDVLHEVTGMERDSQGRLERCDALMLPLGKADMRLQWKAWSTRRRVAHVAGCTLAMFTGAGLGLAFAPMAAWAAGPYVAGTLGLAGALYATSFALRAATTTQARLLKTYRGGEGSRSGRPYRSVYELLRTKTRLFRNVVYQRVGLPGPPPQMYVKDENGHSYQREELSSYSFSMHGRSERSNAGERIYASWALGVVTHAADLVYQADSIVARVVGRSVRLSFCSQAGFRQIAGHTGGGLSAYDWYTPAARECRLGHARLKWARFVGIGGADVIGGSGGCLAVAAAWGAVSKFSGGVVPVAVIGGVGVLKPVSGMGVPAVLWAVSLMMEAPLPLIRKMSDRQRKNAGRKDSALPIV